VVNDSIDSIDAHKLKIQERGYLKFLPKSLGVNAFRKNCQGGSPYFGFIAFVAVSPPSPHLCASVVNVNRFDRICFQNDNKNPHRETVEHGYQ